jgi:hypothetical protein
MAANVNPLFAARLTNKGALGAPDYTSRNKILIIELFTENKGHRLIKVKRMNRYM